MGGRDWHVYWVPGHSPGHMFLVSEDGIMLAGDHILPYISPNISVHPYSRPDALRDYFSSLDLVDSLNLPHALLLPGHGKPLNNVAARTVELRESHKRRSKDVIAALETLQHPAMAIEVTRYVFRHRELRPDDMQLAIGEISAHLVYLIGKGLVAKDSDGPFDLFTLTK